MEHGRDHLLDPDDPTRPAADYSNDEIKFHHRHFLGPDPFLEPRTFRRKEEDGDHLHVGDVNSIPATVGGGGTHADGKVPRFREEDFTLLSALGPQPGAEVADWPLTYDELEPYYAEVERAIGVAGEAGANPFAAWRSGPYPMPPGAPMYSATLSTAAAERLGYHPYPAPTAANSVPYDGRPACNNCGFCAFFGCPIHAKGDPVALLLRVMATGRAELRSETFVTRIKTDGRRATGVQFIGPDGVERSMDARHVVVAGGAVETPRLLLLSGIGNDLVGRYLMVHFQTIVVGTMPFAPARPARAGRDPRPRRRHRGRRRLAGGGQGGRPALDARRPGRARVGAPPDPRGPGLPLGRGPRAADAPVAAAGPPGRLHHAGRGPALRHQPGRPRPDGARRAGAPGGTGHLPRRPPRAGRLRPPRPAARGRAQGDGRRVDHDHHLAGRRLPRRR